MVALRKHGVAGRLRAGITFELGLESHVRVCQTGKLRRDVRQRNSTHKGKDCRGEW